MLLILSVTISAFACFVGAERRRGSFAVARVRCERGAVLAEFAQAALPLIGSVVCCIFIAGWLIAIAQVNHEAVMTSTNALATMNSDLNASFTADQLYINQQTSALQSEAESLAKNHYGYKHTQKYHRAVANELAGSAKYYNYAYGITDTPQAKKQLLGGFDPNWYTVYLRMPGTPTVTVKARVLKPVPDVSASPSPSPPVFTSPSAGIDIAAGPKIPGVLVSVP